jgi:hypothetical protein
MNLKIDCETHNSDVISQSILGSGPANMKDVIKPVFFLTSCTNRRQTSGKSSILLHVEH